MSFEELLRRLHEHGTILRPTDAGDNLTWTVAQGQLPHELTVAIATNKAALLEYLRAFRPSWEGEIRRRWAHLKGLERQIMVFDPARGRLVHNALLATWVDARTLGVRL